LTAPEVRARIDADTLSGMEVRAAVRRTRLPLAALLLAALLGAPAPAAVAVEARPAPDTVVSAVHSGATITADASGAESEPAPPVSVPAGLPAAPPEAPALGDGVAHAPRAPRAPPLG
jgi:hypothetical protein